jgi:hypothetical protein
MWDVSESRTYRKRRGLDALAVSIRAFRAGGPRLDVRRVANTRVRYDSIDAGAPAPGCALNGSMHHRVTALAPSGQHAGVTEIGVKQLRVAGQQSAAGEPADRSLARRRYLSRSAILHAAARDMLTARNAAQSAPARTSVFVRSTRHRPASALATIRP